MLASGMNFKKPKESFLLNNNKILAIIPARSGSKRLQNKNLMNFCDKPLVSYSFIAANKSKYIDSTIISSDSNKIIQIAEEYDVKAPFIRPKKLSEDKTAMFPVIKHAIENIDESFDLVVLLQPTSPLRTADDIDNALQKFTKHNAKALISVNKVDHPIEWIISQKNNIPLGSYAKNFNSDKRSQDYKDSFILNGAIFISRIDELLSKKTFFTEETIIFSMKKSHSIDIDNEDDFRLAEYYMKSEINK